jgi:hypothetical protein
MRRANGRRGRNFGAISIQSWRANWESTRSHEYARATLERLVGTLPGHLVRANEPDLTDQERVRYRAIVNNIRGALAEEASGPPTDRTQDTHRRPTARVPQGGCSGPQLWAKGPPPLQDTQ